jgi:hypothetical protein
MKQFLSKSYASVNNNKINGLMAEIDFRKYLGTLGFSENISVGGWIARSVGINKFSQSIIVMFPETIRPDINYSANRKPPNPSNGLHTICATFHQIGIHSYFCSPIVTNNDPYSVSWKAIELGLPAEQIYFDFPEELKNFSRRDRPYNFLRYKSVISNIPIDAIPEEFTKENIRCSFQHYFMSEVSDIDGILWGKQFTYPLEIKEKTPGFDPKMGEYFGIDVGPFVKLSFYAAKRGNLHSLFIVREIENETTRKLAKWWYITFENLAQYASWTPISGGRSMRGNASSVIKVPKSEFSPLTHESLLSL